MKCHCCGGNYKSIGNNSFKCVDCNHMYVNYKGDGLEYHKNEYRSKNKRVIPFISKVSFR